MIFRRKAVEAARALAARVTFTPGTIVREGATATSVIPPSGGGDTTVASDPLSYWIRLGAGAAGGFYDYERVVRDPSTGIWNPTGQYGVVGGTGPTTPAHEVNNFVGLAPTTRVRAFPTPGTTAIEFQAEECEPGV